MLKFNTVVLSTTNLCNLRCRHCFPSSGPSKEEMHRFGNSKTMSPQQAEVYIRQIPQLKNVEKLLHLGGGESTLFKEEFKDIVSLGKKYNLRVSMVTNCSWAKNQGEADHFIEDLAKRGMMSVQMSVSKFHQEQLAIDYVVRAIRSCKKFGVLVIVRPIVIKSHGAADILQNIPTDVLEGVKIASSKCQAVGRAREQVSEEDLFHEDLRYTGCHQSLNLTIRQDGSVYPCCAGSDITDSLCLGNADEEPLADIITRAELDPLLNILVFQGTRYLSEILRDYKGIDFTKKRYGGICELCNDMFLDNNIAREVRLAVMEHLRKKEAEQFLFQPT